MFIEENATSSGVTVVLLYKILLPTVLGGPVMQAIAIDQGGSTRTALSMLTMILMPTFQGVTVPGTETASSLSTLF